MITIQWTKRNGETRNTTYKASTAARFLLCLERWGYEWKIIDAE